MKIRDSPSAQTLVVGVVLLCCVGLNSAVLGLGAGGSRPENIPTVDRVNYIGAFVLVGSSCFGGLITNKLGPRNTVAIAATGYPVYVGSLWFVPRYEHSISLNGWRALDKGTGSIFPYLAAAYHGVCAALLYSAGGLLPLYNIEGRLNSMLTEVGFITSTYSSENLRGKYIAAPWMFISLGATLAAGKHNTIDTIDVTDENSHCAGPNYLSRPLMQPGRDHVTCKAIMQGYAQTCDALLICLIWPLWSRAADHTDHYRALLSLQYYIEGRPIPTSIGLS